MTTDFDMYVRQSVEVLNACLDASVKQSLNKIIECLQKAIIEHLPVLICGNGGSASDAEHFAAELVCRYKKNRKAFNVMALSHSGALATAISNDLGYENIFARQVEAYAQSGGVLIGISTSGTSPNIIKAMETGKKIGLTTIAMIGSQGEIIAPHSDMMLSIPSTDTPLIQQAHLLCYHFICDQLEKNIPFDNNHNK